MSTQDDGCDKGKGHGKSRGKDGSWRAALQSLQNLDKEHDGGPRVAPLLLAVAAARIEAAVGKAIREAGSRRRTDFRSWVQEHSGGGSGALHRFCNQEN